MTPLSDKDRQTCEERIAYITDLRDRFEFDMEGADWEEFDTASRGWAACSALLQIFNMALREDEDPI